MSERIGGRLWSTRFEGATTPMEMGGMRYIIEAHPILYHYIQELRIPQLPFKMKGDYLQQRELKTFLRNDRYRQSEW